MAFVVIGRLNKQIAVELNLSEIMVKATGARPCARCGPKCSQT